MRTTAWLLLVVVCLGFLGCKHSGSNNNAPTPPSPPAGGGSPVRDDPLLRKDTTSPPAGSDGLLAGQVLDAFNHRPGGVMIQVVDLQDTRSSPARIEVEANEQGYFTIQGLQVGRHYQLIARVKDGTKVLSGTTLAVPPNPRLSIYVNEDNTTPATPPLPGPPGLPEKKKTVTGGAALESPTHIEAPRNSDGETPLHNQGGVIPAPPTTGLPNATKTADSGLGWVPPKVTIPNPYGPLPEKKEDVKPPIPTPPAPTPPAATPPAPTPAKLPVPDSCPAPTVTQAAGPTPLGSCVLVGQKLVDFSLSNLDGDAWRYKRDRKGQLVLLDFWTTGNDVAHIHQLVRLQKSYGPYGLEVVGIAYEGGAIDQQVKNVRSIRGRYGVNYPTLLGGPADTCQVKKQFDVNKYPTLILLDDHGQFLYRTEGLEKPQAQELEAEIRKRLGIADTYPHAGE